MSKLPFIIGEASTLKEDIGRKHFTYLPARRKKEIKKYGSLFFLHAADDDDQVEINDIIDNYYENADKFGIRVAIRKTILSIKPKMDFLFAIAHKNKLYYAFSEYYNIFLLRNGELRDLSLRENDFLEEEDGYFFGEYFLFVNDTITILQNSVKNLLSERVITDILSEYKENVAAKELLSKAVEEVPDEPLTVVTIRVNDLKKINYFGFLKFFIFLVILFFLGYGVYKTEFWHYFKSKSKKVAPVKTPDTPVVIKKTISKFPVLPKLKWKKKLGGSLMASPTVYKNTLYVASKDKYLYAVDLKSDMVKWKKFMAYSIASTPLVIDDAIFLGTYKGVFYRLSLNGGKIVWRFKTYQRIVSSPSEYKNRIYFGSFDSFLYAISKNGKKIWRAQTDGIIFSSPVLAENKIVVTTLGGRVYVISADSGRIKWNKYLGGPVYTTAAYYNGTIFVGGNGKIVYAFDLESGRLKWKYSVDSEIAGKVVTNGKYVFLGTEKGTVYAFDMNGKLKWQYKTGGHVRKSLLCDNEILYVGSYDKFFSALNASSGALLWRDKLDSAIYAAPYLHKKTLFVVTTGGMLYSYEADLKKLKPALLKR